MNWSVKKQVAEKVMRRPPHSSGGTEGTQRKRYNPARGRIILVIFWIHMGEDKEARIKFLLSMTGEIMKTLHFLTNSEYKGKKPA